MQKLIFNWSGGKDSAMALHQLRRQNNYEILCLLTSVSEAHQRVSMHGVRKELLQEQAEQLQLPLITFDLPESADMEAYNALMYNTLQPLALKGATIAAFGDIFLEDLRRYREQQLQKLNLEALFPIWGINTKELLRAFVDNGFKAIITCVNEKHLDKSFAGRYIDSAFIKDLPDGVDPCGENGEYHSFVFDGPVFSKPVAFEKGETVHKKYNAPDGAPYDTGFWFCDLIPVKK